VAKAVNQDSEAVAMLRSHLALVVASASGPSATMSLGLPLESARVYDRATLWSR
jgi:hypothetical protein